jgi:monoamine oxidase
MKIYFLLALLMFSSRTPAQNKLTVTAQEQEFYNKAMPVIKKEYKNLVLQTAGRLKGKNINTDSLVNAMKGNRMLTGLNVNDIEALAFLVLMEASKSSQEDLKSIMATTKEINKEKQSFRNTEQVSTARTDTSQKAINSRITTLKIKKDSVNDMNEMTQLRLQMTMDRKNKVMTALSNIMKRISGTQDQIISNLK